MADKTLEFEVDFGRGIAWLLVPDMGSGRNMVRALAERVAMTETGLIMSTYPNSNCFRSSRNGRERVNHVSVYCNILSHGHHFWERGRKRMATGKCV